MNAPAFHFNLTFTEGNDLDISGLTGTEDLTAVTSIVLEAVESGAVEDMNVPAIADQLGVSEARAIELLDAEAAYFLSEVEAA